MGTIAGDLDRAVPIRTGLGALGRGLRFRALAGVLMLRSLSVAVAGILLAAAHPPPPAALEPYIKDGQFDHGDFGWMRGAFDDASEQEKADYRAIEAWTDECLATAKAEVAQQLRERGYPAARTEVMFLGPLVCMQAAMRPAVTDKSSFAAFDRERVLVAPIIDSFLIAVRLAESRSAAYQSGFVDELQVRPVGEQILRSSLLWGRGQMSDAPALSPVGAGILQARLGAATLARDHANTEWLKAQIRERGWPKISEVGAPAAEAARLLALHADADPLFQLEALQLMEPLLPSQEVSRQLFPYFYDRAMLRIAAKQRYGTQMTCVNGELATQPLEDEGAVDRLRAEVGLEEPLATYAARMRTSSPPCR